MSRPRLLDLFCCEGGAAEGYHRAGFEVIGIDNKPQPNYPFQFIQGDALQVFGRGLVDMFHVVHASPPCQAYTTWVIENVVGARRHMRSPVMLHGGHFGLNVYRPRLSESNCLLTPPPAASPPKDAAAVYGRREDRRLLWRRKDGSELRAASLEEARVAMGMPWASWNGVREAIPPAYTEWIGAQLLAHVAVGEPQ